MLMSDWRSYVSSSDLCAPERYPFGKSRKQAGGHGGRKNDKTAPVVRPSDESTKGLRQSGSDQPVIIGAAAPRQTPRGMEHQRLRPGHTLPNHQPQRKARNGDAVAHRSCAKQRSQRSIAKTIDQRPRKRKSARR